jgi:hypothetical protein
VLRFGVQVDCSAPKPVSRRKLGTDRVHDSWVGLRRYAFSHVEVRCYRSREKCLHAEPAGILIDDWKKYRHLWIAKGGVWLTHRSAAGTALALDALGL